MPKAVVDANIIVSALFGGTPHRAFVKAISTCEIYISPEIEQELVGLLKLLKSKLPKEKLKKLSSIISNLLLMTKKVDVTSNLTICRDNKDNKYLSLCLDVGADFLVTGDRDLLEIETDKLYSSGLSKLNILKPAEFLKI